MKILWLSSNRFGYELLCVAKTLPGVTVQAVMTLAAGASTKMYDAIARGAWSQLGLPVVDVHRIENETETIQKFAPDLLVAAGWRQRIPLDVLSVPKFGVIGFHPTLLPLGRGPAPIINSILEGITQSGVTMLYLCEEIDAGDIVGQEPFTIGENDDAGDVYEKVIVAGKKLVEVLLPQIALGAAPRLQQDDSRATYFEKRSPRDNEILPTDSADLQCRKIRAFARPYLGAFRLDANGNKQILWRVEDLTDS